MNLNAGPIKRIHINRQVIQQNAKTGKRRPPISIKVTGHNVKAREVKVDGPCTVVYRPDKPLSCGAKLWIETRSKVAARL